MCFPSVMYTISISYDFMVGERRDVAVEAYFSQLTVDQVKIILKRLTEAGVNRNANRRDRQILNLIPTSLKKQIHSR